MRNVDGDNEWLYLDLNSQIFKKKHFQLWFLHTELLDNYKLLYVSTR